jgi:hypothetical protein
VTQNVPAKGKSRITETQRRRIAAGKLASKTDKRIAHEEGLARQTVNRVANDARTTTLVLRLKERHEPELEKMYAKSLRGINKRLDSKDDLIAQRAQGQLLRFIEAGDPPLYRIADQGSTDGDFTLEELLMTMRSVTGKG